MVADKARSHTCAVCGKVLPRHELVPGTMMRDVILDAVRKECPHWSQDDSVCREDLARLRSQYVHGLLESEKGELTSLEQEVVDSMARHEIFSTNVDAEAESGWTFGQRLADRIASFGGSWAFIMIFSGFLTFWIVLNSIVLISRPADPCRLR